jgi:glycerol-3-phosphate cytidylyltransferase
LKKIGYTCGVYDLFHVGHLNLFERCKQKCDYLIVGVCDDEYVRQFKDKNPIIGETDRARIVGALKCVDEVHIIDSKTTVDKLIAHDLFKYNVLFVGSDWKGTERFIKTEQDFKDKNLDIDIVFLPYTQSVSTSSLREQLKKD